MNLVVSIRTSYPDIIIQIVTRLLVVILLFVALSSPFASSWLQFPLFPPIVVNYPELHPDNGL